MATFRPLTLEDADRIRADNTKPTTAQPAATEAAPPTTAPTTAPMRGPRMLTGPQIREAAQFTDEERAQIDAENERDKGEFRAAIDAETDPKKRANMEQHFKATHGTGEKTATTEAPPKWSQIESSPKYQKLDSAGKEAVRLSYWKDVVSPMVPTDQLEEARKAFDERTKPTLMKQATRAVGDLVDRMMPAPSEADANVSQAEIDAASQPARNVMTKGGQQLPADKADIAMDPNATPPTWAQRPITEALKPMGKTPPVAVSPSNQYAQDMVRGQKRSMDAGEIAMQRQADAGNKIFSEDFNRNVATSIQNVPADWKQIMGGAMQALGEAMPEAGGKDLARMGADFYDQGAFEMKQNSAGMKPGLGAQAVGSAVQSLARMLPVLGLSFGSAAAVITMMGGATGAQKYAEGRAEGMVPAQAALYAAAQGVIEAATEYLPVKALLAKYPNMASHFYNFVIREVPSELLATTLQNAVEKVSLQPNMTVDDLINDLAVTALSTPLAAGVQTGAARLLQRGQPEQQAERPPEVRLQDIHNQITDLEQQAGIPPAADSAAPEGPTTPPPPPPAPAAPTAPTPEPGGTALPASSVLGKEEPDAETPAATAPAQSPSPSTEGVGPAAAAPEEGGWTSRPTVDKDGKENGQTTHTSDKGVIREMPGSNGTTWFDAYQFKGRSLVDVGVFKSLDEAKAKIEGRKSDLEQAAEGLKGIFDSPVDEAAHQAATSPHNETPQPSDEQKKAGNYQKGHINIGGLDISVENPAGSERSGKDANGNPWSVTMQDHYGYIKGTVGRDKDHVDIFVKQGTPDAMANGAPVFIIDQKKSGNGHFDEHKVMLGWGTEEEAVAAYKANYTKGWDGIRHVTEMSLSDFKNWLQRGDTKQPAEHTKPEGEPETMTLPMLGRGEGYQGVPSAKIEIQKFRSGKYAYGLQLNTNVTGMGYAPRWSGANYDSEEEARKAAIGEATAWAEKDRPAASDESNKAHPKHIAHIMKWLQSLQPDGGTSGGETPPSKGEDYKVTSGEILRSGSGRLLSPVPKIDTTTPRKLTASIQRMNEWLLVEAKKEAEHTGVDYHKTLLKAINLNNVSQSDQDTMNQLLFGQPEGPISKNRTKPEETTVPIEDDRKKPIPVGSMVASPMEGANGMEVVFTQGQKGLHATLRDKDSENSVSTRIWPYDKFTPKEAMEKARAWANEVLNKKTDIDRELKELREEEKRLIQGLPVAEEMMINDRGASLRRLEARIEENRRKQEELLKRAGLIKGESNAVPEQGTESEKKPDETSDTDGGEDWKVKIARLSADKLAAASGFTTITEWRAWASEKAGISIKPGTIEAKQLDEAIEAGVVLAARQIVARGRLSGATDKEIYGALVELYRRQPNLNVRTSTSIEQQAYSTPVPLSFIASRLAGVDTDTQIYEPTAGNGSLLIEAGTKRGTNRAFANELNPDRAAMLESMGFRVRQGDATVFNPKENGVSGYGAEVVLANPPFGYLKVDGKNREWKIDDRYTTNQIDHAISMKALSAMKEDGRAVLIVGAPKEGKQDGYEGIAKRSFYFTLYRDYNVVDHFTVSGDLYAKQGAAWPVDVIVIHGRGKSSLPLPQAKTPPLYKTWGELTEKLDAKYEGSRPDSRPGSDAAATDSGSKPAGADGARPQPDGGSGPTSVNQPGSDGRPAPIRPGGDTGQRPAAGFDDGANDRPGERGEGGQSRGTDTTPDIGAMFDEELKKLFEEDSGAPPATKTEVERAPRTAGEAGASAAKETLLGLSEVAKGLDKLFGGKGTLGSGPVFDDETYAKAKPFFIQGVKHFQKAGADVREMIAALLRALREQFNMAVDAIQRMKPYVVRFVEEVTAGKIQLGETVEPPKRTERRKDAETDLQVDYEPTSQVGAIGTLLPVNMKTSIAEALAAVESRVGNIDAFVAKELDYPLAKLGEYFSAEQVDSLALSLDSMKRGAGFIIGDQTGVGKGRVNAAVIRWAIKHGKTPIFVTEKPNLYGDMVRDLTDIGMPGVRPFMTNAEEDIPLDDEAALWYAEYEMGVEEARQRGDKPPRKPPVESRPGKWLKTTRKTHAREMLEMQNRGVLDGYDVVFTTYSQMQTIKGGQRTARMDFLEAVANDAVVILDESHNAGGGADEGAKEGGRGKDDGKELNRATFARGLLRKAMAAFYSSATYAKRPEVMDLYFRTDMSKAVDNISALPKLIRSGGVPLQQVLASMLAKAGQYIRRERSFAGIRYDTIETEVDKDIAEAVSNVMRQIVEFDKAKKAAIKALDKEAKSEAKKIMEDGSIGAAGVSSTNFTSIMHNIVGQMLLALKVVPVADMAIESLKRGEKPVLTVANTMGSFISQYVEDNDLQNGDAIAISFNDLMLRYLERSRDVLVGDAYGKKERRRLTDEELGRQATAMWEKTRDFINESDFSKVPISPIDYIKARIEKAGYTFGEVTGRQHTVDYAGEQPVYRVRPAAALSVGGRKSTIAAFNSGKTDVILLNQAGATGLSLHASSKFKNQQQRHMMIIQAEANIDTHMQMLGRVHRTGQVIEPRYSQLTADVPAEKRPAAILARKMASLNANTTASRDSAVTAKGVVDFMNEYGDEVVAQLMTDYPEWHKLMDEPLDTDPETGGLQKDGAIRRVTGRMPIMSLAAQAQLYDLIEDEYRALVEEKDRLGENALEAKTLDLDAKTESVVPVFEGKGGDSPFAAGANAEMVDVKRLGRAYKWDELLDRIRKGLKAQLGEMDSGSESGVPASESADWPEINDTSDWRQIVTVGRKMNEATREKLEAEFAVYKINQIGDAEPNKAKALETALDAHFDRVDRVLGFAYPGRPLTLRTRGGSIPAVVMEVKQSGHPKNPAAPGTWKVTFAVADAMRQVTIPISRLYVESAAPDNARDMGHSILADYTPPTYLEAGKNTIQDAFAAEQSVSREKRIIVTGNLLAGYGKFERGRIVNYTKQDGSVTQGILMPADFNLDKALDEQPVEFPNAALAIQFVEEMAKRGTPVILESVEEGVFTVKAYGNDGEYRISVAASKEKGGRIFLNQNIRRIVEQDFVKAGAAMRVDVPRDQAVRALQEIMAFGYKVKTKSHKAEAKAFLEKKGDKYAAIKFPDGWGIVDTASNSRENPEHVEYPTRSRNNAELQGILDAISDGISAKSGIDFPHGSIEAVRPVDPGAVRGQSDSLLERGRDISLAARIGEFFRHEVVWFKNNRPELVDFGGVSTRRAPDKVFININVRRPVTFITGHELLHRMKAERPDLYEKFRNSVRGMLQNVDQYEHALAKATELEEEVLADFVGWNFTKPEFWRALKEKNSKIFGRIADYVLTFIGKLTEAFNRRTPAVGRFITDLEAARAALIEVLEEWQMGPTAETGTDLKFSRATQQPTLRVDNPGGEWLDNKRADNNRAGRGEFGQPGRFGPVTATFDRKVNIPVSVLARIPGMRGEQSRVRQGDLSSLKEYMSKNGRLPPLSADNSQEYAPFIMVNQDGEAWVNEGNHRIMAARDLGWKSLPVEIRYFTGGEQANGPLSPEKVIKYDTDSESRFESRSQTNTEAFKRWFGNSKVVDAQGRPMVVYHGTAAKFTQFAGRSKHIAQFSAEVGASFFTSDMEMARGYAGGANDPMPVYLSIQNPYVHDANGAWWLSTNYKVISAARDNGHDGVIIRNVIDTSAGQVQRPIDVFITFRPEQIKSAIGNVGSFDSSNPDIRFAPNPRSPQENMARDTSLTDRVFSAPFKLAKWERLADRAWNKIDELNERLTSRSEVYETMRAGFEDKYGLPEDYNDRRVEMSVNLQRWARGASTMIDKLAGLTRDEARVAYEWMNERNADELLNDLPENSRETLQGIKELIRSLGEEAVNLGQLSREVFERNELAYLHRSYLRHELEQTLTAKLGNRKAIATWAEQYKQRGIKDWRTPADLRRGDPKLDLRDMKGKKFHRLELRARPRQDGGRPRIRKVIYWPTNKPIPMEYQNWHNDGVWEVRWEHNGKWGLWRDLTPEERQNLGEIDEIRFAVAKTLHLMTHDIEVGRMQQWVSNRYAERNPPPGARVMTTKEADGLGWLAVYRKNVWVKVPDTKVEGTNTLRYGALAGKYVPGPIWNDIRQNVGLGRPSGLVGRLFDDAMRMWKASKTALSPGVHTNNIMANFFIADFHDLRAKDLLKSLRVLLDAKLSGTPNPDNAELYRRFEDSGALHGMFKYHELRKELLEPLLENIRREALNDEQGAMTRTLSVISMLNGLERAGKGIKKYTVDAMIETYSAEDEVFRLAIFLKGVRHGLSDLEAGRISRKAFLDYDINAPWIQALRRSVFPFIAFPYRAIPMMIDTFTRKPWKPIKYMAVASTLNALAYMLLGLGAGDEDRERRLMPAEKSGKIWGMFPKLMRMPWNSDKGDPVFLDVRRWFPGGDVFDVNSTHAALPMSPTALPGGPIALMAELFSDKSQFTGQPITDWQSPAVDGIEAAEKLGLYLYRFAMPNNFMIPGTWAFGGLKGALGFGDAGKQTDVFGREMSLPQAAWSAVGVKLGTYPEEVMRYNLMQKYRADSAKIQESIYRMMGERQRNKITQEQLQRGMSEQMGKLKTLTEEFREKVQPPERR